MKPAVLALPFATATLFLAAPIIAGTRPADPLAPGGATYQELLQRYDTNHDGKLDDNELAAAHEALTEQRFENGKGVGKKVRQQLLEMFDKEHKGYLNADERESARQYLQQHLELRRQFLLERYDKNGDGKLDDSERAAMQADLEKMRANHSAVQNAPPPAGGSGDNNLPVLPE